MYDNIELRKREIRNYYVKCRTIETSIRAKLSIHILVHRINQDMEVPRILFYSKTQTPTRNGLYSQTQKRID